jgi:hypothetical protein
LADTTISNAATTPPSDSTSASTSLSAQYVTLTVINHTKAQQFANDYGNANDVFFNTTSNTLRVRVGVRVPEELNPTLIPEDQDRTATFAFIVTGETLEEVQEEWNASFVENVTLENGQIGVLVVTTGTAVVTDYDEGDGSFDFVTLTKCTSDTTCDTSQVFTLSDDTTKYKFTIEEDNTCFETCQTAAKQLQADIDIIACFGSASLSEGDKCTFLNDNLNKTACEAYTCQTTQPPSSTVQTQSESTDSNGDNTPIFIAAGATGGVLAIGGLVFIVIRRRGNYTLLPLL